MYTFVTLENFRGFANMKTHFWDVWGVKCERCIIMNNYKDEI
jgi:hypothetical protein